MARGGKTKPVLERGSRGGSNIHETSEMTLYENIVFGRDEDGERSVWWFDGGKAGQNVS